ncbi:hypothetical protein [Solwaraspora sp. WMMA2101]|uniref:hypothetical protein n=2 Tax=unclassified Solwaraspora TaxID=2627926 RepID=UPI003B92A389
MLRISRRARRRDLVRAELGESLDHFMQAATHAAGGVGATVGPRIHAARTAVGPTADRMRDSASQGMTRTMATLAPLAVAAADGARQAGRATRKAKATNMLAARKSGMRAMAAAKSTGRTKAVKAKAMKTRAKNSRFTPGGGKDAGRRRWPMIVGLLAAAGALGTMAVRRRRAAQWEEYDPGQALDSMRAASNATNASAVPGPVPGTN